jgi:hypothetical protein
MTLSVDIGHQYVAYAHYFNNQIRYGIYQLSEYTDCSSRCQGVVNFLSSFHFSRLIIEKQVGQNIKAMQIQYALVAAGLVTGDSRTRRIVEIQHAREKFQILGLPLVTRGKAHKKLSVRVALEWVDTVDDRSDVALKYFEKQDDVADAINMLRASILREQNGLWETQPDSEEEPQLSIWETDATPGSPLSGLWTPSDSQI